MEEPRKIYSLTDLAKSLRSVIERAYASTYWVKAEVAKLNHYPRSGHCYPDLVEKTGDQVMAQMRALIWAGDFRQINRQFLEVTGEPLREGMAILFQTSVTFHPVYGLSLQIHQVEPSFTLGQMAHEKMKNLERLREEGIFDRNKSLPMPLLPRRVAVVSVETSKGYHDFLKILDGYKQSFGLWHHLFPAVLQGDKAVESIMGGLRRIRKKHGLFDLVALIRGGGGDVGLNCYDNYTLAREIATFPIPVITGIGHATNETIAEMVAWENKVTPTDVAYFLLGRFQEFDLRTSKARDRIFEKANQVLDYEKHHLHATAAQMKSIAAQTLEKDHYRVKNLQIMLGVGSRALLEKASANLLHRTHQLRLLNPEEILKRGYSITSLNGKPLRKPNEVKDGDLITTRLHEGQLESIVKKNQTHE